MAGSDELMIDGAAGTAMHVVVAMWSGSAAVEPAARVLAPRRAHVWLVY
jgi:hypothetical protein